MRKALMTMMIAAVVMASTQPAMAAQAEPEPAQTAPEPPPATPPAPASPPAPAPPPAPVVIPPATYAPVLPPPAVAANPANRLTLELSNGGRVVIQLRPDAAPAHVERIQTLVRRGFYNGVAFHRVIPGFMAQGGDPQGTGVGGSGLPDLRAEFTTIPYMRGIVAAARTDDPHSANSQFFIMYSPNIQLWGKYTVFGRVVAGMDAVDRIAVGEPPAQPTRIVRASLGDMVVVQAPAPALPAPAAPPAPPAPAEPAPAEPAPAEPAPAEPAPAEAPPTAG